MLLTDGYIRQREHERIERQIAEFESRGGKIEKLDWTASSKSPFSFVGRTPRVDLFGEDSE